jgi:DNA replication protein DnaC
LKQRYQQLGEEAVKFLEGLLQSQRNGWQQAEKVLAQLATYRTADFQAALERAVRYGAFSLSAVQRILADFATMRVPLSAEQLDEVLRTAEQQGLSHLEFLQRLVGTQAQQRRERAVERRIREACFREVRLLADFDWEFNAGAIDRVQIEQLATGDFVRRGDNLVVVGQSGVGKSHLVQALGRQCCVLGYHVRYTTSAELLLDLTAALADQSLPARLKYWTRVEWLIIDDRRSSKIRGLYGLLLTLAT